MNYTNGSARCHVIQDRSAAATEKVLSLEMTSRGLRLCVRKPATLVRWRRQAAQFDAPQPQRQESAA